MAHPWPNYLYVLYKKIFEQICIPPICTLLRKILLGRFTIKTTNICNPWDFNICVFSKSGIFLEKYVYAAATDNVKGGGEVWPHLPKEFFLNLHF